MELSKLINGTNVKELLSILAVFILGHMLDKFLRRLLSQVPSNLDSPRTRTYLSVISSLITGVIYLTVTYFALSTIGVNLTPLFASASIVGIIVGMGLRPLIEDFLQGYLFLLRILSMWEIKLKSEESKEMLNV